MSAVGVLFDLDGTLVDSAVDLLNALNQIVVAQGQPALPLSAIRPVVSKGARAMLRVAFPDRDEAARELLLQPFLDCYEAAVAHHSTPFDGIEETLRLIEAAGSRWGIVTNKMHYLAREVVASMGWASRNSVLIGGDTLPNKKPDPEGLLLAMRELNVDPSRCAYVGDAPEDIEMGRRGNVMTIGVRSMYPSSARVLSANPDLYLQQITELVAHF